MTEIESYREIDGQVVDAVIVEAADRDFSALAHRARPGGYDDAYVRDRPLSAGAQRLVTAGVPTSTRATYKRAWDHYEDYGIRRFGERAEEELLPSLESTMIEYVHLLRGLPVHNRCQNGRQNNGDECTGHRPAPSSLWIWYSAVRMAHAITDPPYPWYGGKRLALAMKAYCEEMADKLGWEPNVSPRAWPEHVTAMVDALDMDEEASIRDRALILTGWYTGARASDLATYRVGDPVFTPKGIDLTLRNSKTNKSAGRKTERRVLRPAANPRYCAVRAMDAWVNGVLRRKYGITQGALFRPYTKPGPVTGARTLLRGSRDALGYKMAGVSISGVVKAAAVLAGIPDGEYFTEHSLRRGRASHLRSLKLDQLAIARALGWKNLPPATYMEEAEAFDDEAPANIGLLG